MGSQICVSVEFDSEGVEIGRQEIGVEYYVCETYLWMWNWQVCWLNIEAGGLNAFYYFSNYYALDWFDF